MGIHRDLANKLVANFRGDSNVLAVNIFGSVAEGREHDKSDLDLQVVVKNGDWKLTTTDIDGITVDYEVCPKNFLVRRVEKYPFLCHIFLSSECLYDVGGLMEGLMKKVRDYFDSNQEVLTFWDLKVKLKRELKKMGKGKGFFVGAYDEAEILFSPEHKVTRDFYLGEG